MRLVHQTFLVLAAVVLIAVTATAALFALTLERGFVAYVNARQLEQFEALHRLLVAEAARSGSLDAVKRDEIVWRRLLRRSAPAGETDGANFDGPPREDSERPPGSRLPLRRPLAGAPDAPFNRPPRADGGLPLRPPLARDGLALPRDPGLRLPLPGDSLRPPRDPGFRPPSAEDGLPLPREPGLRPPPQSPYGLGQNVDLLDANRDPIYMRRRPPEPGAVPVERTIAVGERTAGWLRLWPLQRVNRPEDVAFLRAQYVRLAWGAGGLVLLMLLVAPLVARRVTRPLSRIAAATERIAQGDLDVDLPTTRRDEIGTLMRNVGSMADALARLEQTRRQWIAEIAHELRTPLTVLRAELEALAVGVRQLNAAAVVSLQEETRHLTRLVDDLHQLALADLDALPCTMGPVDLAGIAQRVGDRFRAQAEQKGLRLELQLPSRPVPLQADGQRLEQLLANLLQNSVRYTDAPGRVVVRVDARAGAAVLVVEDSAPGVTAAECERLFDPLYRADKARSRKNGGSGLGLAICRAIVHAHGGKIAASPSALGGLAMTSTLPLAA